jgi:hypothetical protein
VEVHRASEEVIMKQLSPEVIEVAVEALKLKEATLTL